MAFGVNKVILVGNVGQDPEIKEIGNGKVANFSLATSKSWKDKSGEKQEQTEWHRISVFGKLADIVESYVKKGGRLYVEGEINTRKYEKDGEDRYATGIKAYQIQLLDKRGDSSGSSDNDMPWGN